MKIVVSAVLGAFLILATPAYANSYLQMLTTPPENYTADDSASDDDYPDKVQSSNIKNNLWYDYRLVTSAPIEVSSYPKYKAWLETRKYDTEYQYNPKETLQNILYAVEGILVGVGLYMLYKY